MANKYVEEIGFYSRRQVSELTTLSKTTLWRYVLRNTFPAPIKISRGRSAWWRADVHRWMLDKRTQRDQEPSRPTK